MLNYEELKSRLESELTKITKELTSIASLDEKTDDWIAIPVGEDLQEADENVEADAVEEWGNRTAILADLETRYRNIKMALRKMDDGSYGRCEISGEQIEENRLNANPAARTNIANMDRERELPLS
jgi:RNA polymerase-binding transcription factor DksA